MAWTLRSISAGASIPARDVADAVEIGATSLEHGSWRDEIPDRLLQRMAREGIWLDPTLVVGEAYALDDLRAEVDVMEKDSSL